MSPRDISTAMKQHKMATAAAGIVLILATLLLIGWGRKLYHQHKSQQEQREAVVPTVYWVIGPFGPELLRPYEPEVHPDPSHPCKGPNGEKLHWKELPVVEGVQCLDFRKLFRKDNASGYALTYIISPEEQSGTLLMGSDDTIKVWLNGDPVHQYTRFRIGRPDEDRVEVRWKQGRNTLLVKVVNITGDHLFFLKCIGPPGLVATTRPTEGN
jgi:hypothetical protein